MNYNTILKLQKENDLTDTQNRINDGSIWKFEGSVGRVTMDLIKSGACMLPKKPTYDYYGSQLPSRDWLKKGTQGTYQNSVRFWTAVENGEIDFDY